MNSPIKIGLAGIGRAGYSMHGEELASRTDKFKFVAGCDVIAQRAEMFAKQYDAKSYTDISDMIEDPEVELVDIATFSRDHYAHAKMTLEAGKSVFLEKPFAVSTQQARELIELGSKPDGPTLYIRHNRRFERGFETVMDIIDSGILGEVYEIKLTRNSFMRRNDWQTLMEFGGGQVWNWGPHIIDHALLFCGGDYKDFFGELKHVAWLGNSDDHVKIVFKGINDRIVDMEISGGVALPTPEYMVYGTRGTLISERDGFKLKYLNPDKELPHIDLKADPWPYEPAIFSPIDDLPWKEEFRKPAENDDGTARIWDSLYDAMRNNKPFAINPEHAYKIIDIIEQIRNNSDFSKKEGL